MSDRAARLISTLMIVAGLAGIVASCTQAQAYPHPPTELAVMAQAAPAAEAPPVVALPDPGADAGGFAAALLDASRSKNYRGLVALGLMAIVFAVRRFGSKWFAHLGTDRGGALAALLIGVAGAYANALAAGAAIGWGLAYDGLLMGATAAGGWVVVKRIIWPKDTAAA